MRTDSGVCWEVMREKAGSVPGEGTRKNPCRYWWQFDSDEVNFYVNIILPRPGHHFRRRYSQNGKNMVNRSGHLVKMVLLRQTSIECTFQRAKSELNHEQNEAVLNNKSSST